MEEGAVNKCLVLRVFCGVAAPVVCRTLSRTDANELVGDSGEQRYFLAQLEKHPWTLE